MAASDEQDKKPVFSNYGPWVDVSAPGAEIRTTALGANAYATDDGTSLSAPFVSGLAGLLKSRNPTWSAEQLRWQILNTAANIDAANPTYAGQLGKGRINAQAALATTPTPRWLELTGYAIDGVASARPARPELPACGHAAQHLAARHQPQRHPHQQRPLCADYR